MSLMMHRSGMSGSDRRGFRPVIALDLLRGLAAFAVFIGHVRGASFVEFGALPADERSFSAAIFFGLTRLGHEAVLVFFVMSGFLVGGQIIRHLQEQRFEISAYIIERSTRILLPLVPACLLTWFLGITVFEIHLGWVTVLSNMIGLNGVVAATLPGNAPLWSLAYEIWFYIFAGAIACCFNPGNARLPAVAVIVCSVYVFSILEARYLLLWFAGAAVVLILETQWRRPMAVIGTVVAIVGVATSQIGTESKSFINVSYLSPAISDALVCIGVYLTIPLLCSDRTNVALRCVRKPAMYLSAMSYTLYLTHYPILAALAGVFPRANNLSLQSIGLFGLRVFLLLVTSWIFYLLFERNTRTVRAWLKKLTNIAPTSAVSVKAG
jgi:peptidoglycan/LPS O-acetylase OafA/YrhL